MFASYAVTLPRKSRLYKENNDKYKTPFQVDRNRIICSTAFRRLQGKTQVWITVTPGDHYRTRLTHSLEVAEVAKCIAQNLGLSSDLAECIALAHDLGHPPFGHAGEKALDACMKEYGGFSHNAHSFKIITNLERKYIKFNGLNLSWDVLEGIAKHNGPIEDPCGFINNYNTIHDLKLNLYPSLEAQVASISDDITYSTHDIEDGINSGVFDICDLKELLLLKDIISSVESTNIAKQNIAHELTRILRIYLIRDVIEQSRQNILRFDISDITDVENCKKMIIAFSPEFSLYMENLKKFLFKNFYSHHKVVSIWLKYNNIIQNLFDLYMQDTDLMPNEWQATIKEDNKADIIADYIAGMTDRYAINKIKAT